MNAAEVLAGVPEDGPVGVPEGGPGGLVPPRGGSGGLVPPSGGSPGGRPPGANRANTAWEALLAAHATLIKELGERRDVWAEVSMREYDVLYTLSKYPAPISLTELNRHVLLSQPAMSRMVDRLAGRGLVARAVDPDDRRGVRLSLTPAGRDLQRRVGRQHARDVARALRGTLDAGELRQLEAIGRKLAARPARS